MRTHEVIKRHKRLCVRCIETGEIVYTPPDFLRPFIRDREGLRTLATRLDTEGTKPISAIIEFESGIRP